MKNQIKSILILSLYTLYFILYTGSAYAQQPSVSLSPTLTELAIQPGRSTNVRYKFTNAGDPAIIKFRVESASTNPESPLQFKILNEEIELNKEIFVKNSFSEDILLNITAPEGIKEQDYYFDFFIEVQPPPAEEGKGNLRAKITLQSPLLIIVTSTGQVEIKPKITIFDLVPNRKIEFMGFRLNLMDSFRKVPLILIIENKGKNLLKPRGEIIIRGPFGKSNSYPIDQTPILAGSQKRIELDLPGSFIGNYKVSANLTFGEGTPALFAASSFTVMPFKLTITLVILLLLYLIIKKKLKNL